MGRKKKVVQEVQIINEVPVLVKPAKNTYIVQLDFLPSMEIEAEDHDEAIKHYFTWNGIIKTDNPVNIKLKD